MPTQPAAAAWSRARGQDIAVFASAVTLLGRFAELAACQKALSGDGGPGMAAAVITGPGGIGKTSLWRAVAESQPAGVMVLRTAGAPSGQAMFANLADLLDLVAGQVVPRLPAPQASVLRAALGLVVAEMPLRGTLLERAVVAALGDLARAGVVIAIDDEQWVDEDTRQLLETVLVRLAGSPVRWLVSVRSGHAGRGLARALEHELGARVTRIDLAGLDDAALSELYIAPVPGTVVTGGAAAGGGACCGKPVCGAGSGPGNRRPRRP